MPITLSRTSVPPGGELVVWSHLGNLDPAAWRLIGPSGTLTPAWSQPSSGPVLYWTNAYCHQLVIPATVPSPAPGKPEDYTLTNGTQPPVGLKVRAAPRPTEWLRYTQLSKDDPARQIEEILRHGDLSLSPGLYELARPITIPASRRLRGYGATLDVQGDGAFRCGDDVTLEGLTLYGSGNLFAPWSTLLRLTLRRCRFDGLSSGFGPGLVTLDCHWHRCGIIVAGEQLHVRPLFTGCFGGNSCLIRGSGAAIIDGVWRDTDRGPIAQTHNGDVSDCLILHADVSGLTHVFNACEVVAAEGGNRFDYNLILHLRARNCDGPLFQIAGPAARGNVVRDFGGSECGGVVLDSGEHAIEDTDLTGGELRHCGGVYLGRHTTGTRWSYPTTDPFWRGGRMWPSRVVAPRQSNGAQYGFPVNAADWRSVRDDGTDNDTGPGGLEVVDVLAYPLPKPLRFDGS